ncbi:PepSY domain-containing protein [Mesorhizobium sp. IMUNJ 23232]|uniref:PepSY domain-containing protein n=1 Tax=Mesorhizobium sp. IMUNJ 23232 TaxID=3376064 RepID=UPI0037B1D737
MAAFSTEFGDGALSIVVSILSSACRQQVRMGLKNRVRRVFCAFALAVAMTGWAHADHKSRHEDAERASRGAESGEFVPLARIVTAVRARYQGEIVETEFESRHDTPYYEFHILQSDGHLIEIKVDARSGRYLTKQDGDD